MPRTPPTRPLFTPVIPELAREPGPLVLNWLGDLERSTRRTNGYTIRAQFVRPELDAQPLEVRIPLEAIHLLALGTRWRYGRLVDFEGTQEALVRLNLSALDRDLLDVAPGHLIPSWAYKLGGMAAQGRCHVIPAHAGPDLILPVSELVRTWYLFHPCMHPVIQGDGINNPGSLPRALLPWDPDETRQVGEGSHVTYRFSIGDETMRRLARLLFSDYARKQAHALSAGWRSQSASSRFSFPPRTLPPIQGSPLLRIRYRNIEAWPKVDRPRRRLVLSIQGIDHPAPYKELTVLPIIDTRENEHPNPNLPTIIPYGKPVMDAEEPGLPLYGEGSESGLEAASTQLLGFDDNAYRIPARLLDRKPATHRAGRAIPLPERAHAIGTDPSGSPVPGNVAFQAKEMMAQPGSVHQGPPLAHLQMRSVYDEVIAELLCSLPHWEVDYLAASAAFQGVIDMPHINRPSYRFLVLHARGAGRHIYTLRASRADGKGTSHRVLVCRQPGFNAITSQEFATWLRGFPYPGEPVWLNKAGGLRLVTIKLNHQPRPENFEQATWTKKFAGRIASAVLKLAAP